MRNIARINNYYNRQQAWRDWQALAKTALLVMSADEVAKYKPADNAGWRKIDKSIAELRLALYARQEYYPVQPVSLTECNHVDSDNL
jgi:hypothetical protein